MKIVRRVTAILILLTTHAFAQEHTGIEPIRVPAKVQKAFHKKYPRAAKVTWEKEQGNYEANWGGKDGEANSVQFTPSGYFIETVKEIPVNQLPASVIRYVKEHDHATVTEAGKVTNAKGKTFYEAEVHGRDVLFDEDGNFIKTE